MPASDTPMLILIERVSRSLFQDQKGRTKISGGAFLESWKAYLMILP